MKIAICDDDTMFCQRMMGNIDEYVRKKPDAKLTEITVFNDPSEFVLHSDDFDVVFLDIVMTQLNGIDVAKRIIEQNCNIIIVFITGYDNFVFEALSVYPFAFVRKKETATEVPRVLDKIFASVLPKKHMVSFKTSKGEIILDINDIMCFTSIGHSIFAVTSEKMNIKIKVTLKLLEKSLCDLGFVRCHTSYLVNSRYIFSVERDMVVLDNGDEVPLSRYRAEEVKSKLINTMRFS